MVFGHPIASPTSKTTTPDTCVRGGCLWVGGLPLHPLLGESLAGLEGVCLVFFSPV